MKGVVNNRQLFMIQVLLITGYSLISMPKDAYLAAGTGSWIPLILLAALFASGAFILARLNTMFEMQTVCEYAAVLVGKTGAKVLTALYTAYFIFISVLLTRAVATFIKIDFLPQTPSAVLIALLVAVCYYLAYKGITNIARLCTVFGIVFIIASLMLHFVMGLAGDINFILPVMEFDKLPEYIGAAKALVFSFLGIETLAIIPFGPANRARGAKTAVFASLYVGFFYIFATETTVMKIGRVDVLYYDNAIIEALRETQLPRTLLLERADFLYLVIGMFGIVASLSIVAYAATEFSYKLFPQKKRTGLIVAIAAAVFAASALIRDETVQMIIAQFAPYWGLVMAFGIPLLLFALAKFKKIAGKASPPRSG